MIVARRRIPRPRRRFRHRRRRNHNPNARLSEHSYGNALDIMAFVLNDGNVVTVKGGWRGTEQEQGFLRDVFFEACQRFKTVLGPGSDALHYDHFHLDLAHHDAQGKRRYCKPQVAAPQRPFPGTYGPGVNSYPQMNAYAPPPVPNLNSSMIASNTPAYRAPPPLAARPQQPLPAPTSGMESGNINETEPEFDPRDFDLATGSITPLPEPKPVPRVIKTPRRKSVAPASSRGMAYDPAGRN